MRSGFDGSSVCSGLNESSVVGSGLDESSECSGSDMVASSDEIGVGSSDETSVAEKQQW